MFWSAFVSHFTANKRFLAPAVAAQIRREAIARYVARMAAGRADSVLDFTDLVQRIESAIQPN